MTRQATLDLQLLLISPEDNCLIVRHALPPSSLPVQEMQPQPLTGVVRLDETVYPDGRYHCEASEPERPATDYRSEGARPFASLTITLQRRVYLRGRPLRLGGVDVVSDLRSGPGWG